MRSTDQIIDDLHVELRLVWDMVREKDKEITALYTRLARAESERDKYHELWNQQKVLTVQISNNLLKHQQNSKNKTKQ